MATSEGKKWSWYNKAKASKVIDKYPAFLPALDEGIDALVTFCKLPTTESNLFADLFRDLLQKSSSLPLASMPPNARISREKLAEKMCQKYDFPFVPKEPEIPRPDGDHSPPENVLLKKWAWYNRARANKVAHKYPAFLPALDEGIDALVTFCKLPTTESNLFADLFRDLLQKSSSLPLASMPPNARISREKLAEKMCQKYDFPFVPKEPEEPSLPPPTKKIRVVGAFEGDLSGSPQPAPVRLRGGSSEMQVLRMLGPFKDFNPEDLPDVKVLFQYHCQGSTIFFGEVISTLTKEQLLKLAHGISGARARKNRADLILALMKAAEELAAAANSMGVLDGERVAPFVPCLGQMDELRAWHEDQKNRRAMYVNMVKEREYHEANVERVKAAIADFGFNPEEQPPITVTAPLPQEVQKITIEKPGKNIRREFKVFPGSKIELRVESLVNLAGTVAISLLKGAPLRIPADGSITVFDIPIGRTELTLNFNMTKTSLGINPFAEAPKAVIKVFFHPPQPDQISAITAKSRQKRKREEEREE